MPARIAHLPRKLVTTVSAGFGLALALIVALTMLGLHQLAATNAHLESIVQENSVKSRLANQMRDILRDRAISMLTIVVTGDAFERDQEMLHFYGFGSAYQQVRLELEKLIRRPREKEVLVRIDRLTRANQPVMVRTVDLAVEGYTFLAFEELQREGIPLQRALVKELDALIQIQREMTQLAAAEARADYEQTRWLMITLGTLAVLVAGLVAVTVIRRSTRLVAATERERTKFQTLFETNTDGIVILDRKGFSDCNPATLDMFHMNRVEDFLKRRPEDLGVENQPCGTPPFLLAERHISEAVEKGHAFFQWTARRPDGSTFPAEIALHAMNLDGEPVIQAIMRDVSAQKEVEAALEAARDAALAATEMKSQFVANVSHEIRTPMNGILGMTQLLLGSDLNTRQRDYAETIARSGEALMGVINDLLDFSKIEAGRLSVENIDFDLNALLKDVLDLSVPRADAKNLALRLEGDLKQPNNLPGWVRGDPLRVRQILLNLLDNAIKFTHAGEVRLSVSYLESAPNPLHFAVSDSGIGMSEEVQSRVFQAFAQADGSVSRKYGGTGLGLTICRQLAELMGGNLTLESTPGQGSTFHLHLPLPACQSPHADAKANADDLRFPGVSVLVAEDNPINQKLLRFMLENLGVSVQVADDGKAAFDLLDSARVDLVLMDCQMPEWDGLTATRAVREREEKQGRERLPIIALSANAMAGYAEVCQQAGMDDYLSKPLKEEDLAKTLAHWLPERMQQVNRRCEFIRTGAESRAHELAPTGGFDIDKLRRICRNDERQINEMLRLFVSSTESLLDDLAHAVDSLDAAQTARLAHQIKGAAAYLGVEAMTELASESEIQAKAADWPACIAAQEDLEAAFIAVRLGIEAQVLEKTGG
ncbi:MAG: ATP-binding protein [Pseudomonadota bacterium]|nr:ATP-binding protein [Pseudomonadota bacterium]